MIRPKTRCKRGHAYAKWGYAYTSPKGLTANRCRLCRNLSARQSYRKRVLAMPPIKVHIAMLEEAR